MCIIPYVMYAVCDDEVCFGGGPYLLFMPKGRVTKDTI